MKRFKWFVLVVCWVCNTKSCQYCSPSCVESKTFEKKFKCLDSLSGMNIVFEVADLGHGLVFQNLAYYG